MTSCELTKHAVRELTSTGYYSEGGDIAESIAKDVTALISLFSKQGHSGSSAEQCIHLFETLARFKILSPLTGDDAEWNEVQEGVLFQNNRASTVFKEAKSGRCYDIEGKIFIDHDGCSFTSSDSSVDITFPYTPKTEEVSD